MADPLTGAPEEAEFDSTLPSGGALRLLRRRDFRRTYAAVVISELGDSFHYVALMWFALLSAGPLGVLAVRLADSVPALVFGLHGGLVADRSDRRGVMVLADVARGAVLVPIALARLAGRRTVFWGTAVTLPLVGLLSLAAVGAARARAQD